MELAAWQAALQRDETLRLDPVRRRAHGVVHTPPEIARCVVRVVDQLLRERLDMNAGICDERVHVIDPACGPGAFLAAALAHAEQLGGAASVRLSGFDIDAAALDRARELEHHPAVRELSLEQADMFQATSLLALAEHSDRVLALVGNPPWSSMRAEPSPAAQLLLEDFRRDADGERLRERKLGVLSDAYVRFFRICAEVARRARAGAVIGLVSNASFLDGPVHRGMRAALLRWFDAVHVLDLGGSALLGRAAGARDENVFGVRPGVAITWLYRAPNPVPPARVHYARFDGDKRAKLDMLSAADSGSWNFRELSPQPPLLRFVPTRVASADYAGFWSLAECMPFHREGVQSNRDAVVIDADRSLLLGRLRAFVAGSAADSPALRVALRSLPHYDPKLARTRVGEALECDPDGSLGISVQRVAYRPFDERWFCPIAPLCHRPRLELSAACARSTLSLVTVRKDRGSLPWNLFAATSCVIDNCFLSARSSCRARGFPSCTVDGLDNLSVPVHDSIAELLGAEVTALDFQHYALAFLSAASYRATFDDELRQDYPRIPKPLTASMFSELTSLGERVASLFAVRLNTDAPEITIAADLRHRELTIDAANGCVLARGERLLTPGFEALALRVGHHRPLAAYIAGRGEQWVDVASWTKLCALTSRLERLAPVLKETAAAVGGYLEQFRISG